jgi:hypothetical protein
LDCCSLLPLSRPQPAVDDPPAGMTVNLFSWQQAAAVQEVNSRNDLMDRFTMINIKSFASRDFHLP